MSSHKSDSPITGGMPDIPDIPVSRITVTANRTSGLRRSHHPKDISKEPPKTSPRSRANSSPVRSPRSPRTAEPGKAPSKKCESCEENKAEIWNCSYCGMDFCNDCWDLQAPHKPGRKGPDGLPHEKANPTIVTRLKDILTPPASPQEQQALHAEDEDTTWFGIGRNNFNQPIFQDYHRYAAMMADSNTGEYKIRYPQLISFIGQTGAGKSTLIKMLIDQQERKLHSDDCVFPSPVVGSLVNGNVPTSGDVHLYADPGTYLGEFPTLYADCEGLEGGENIPISAHYRTQPPHSRDTERATHPVRERKKLRKLQNRLQYTARELAWANSDDSKKRQYAVTNLYPRLLYTFSDTIVFVLREPKTFESTVLNLMISWGSSSMEKSLNQPTLPHAVIALNRTDTKIDPAEWDPERATTNLMSVVAKAVDRDPTYRNLKDHWNRRGKNIGTMKDLLECYYSSITVVRIPSEGRYMMIDEQVDKLHNVLTRRCKESYHAKQRSRMLSNSETLNTFLECAFDHFANDLHTPFNFMDVSLQINPIPLDFGGNILKLAVAMKPRYDDPKKLFKELGFMVASCILLDCARQNLKGLAEAILERQYLYYCHMALDDFCAIYWPCTFSSRRGDCVNVKENHKKGHQNARGQVIGNGDYVSSFTLARFVDEWSYCLQQNLSRFQGDTNEQMTISKSADELEETTKLHHKNVNEFYERMGGASNFISHTTCFCCLRELAEHPLPCGHVICTPCVKGFGKPHSSMEGSFTLASCPLHDYDAVFPTPCEIYFKPPLAGLRVLSMDGGGMRGIVILEVLQRVQKELGDRIPIMEFFDLVVGTSTGGILALGLGAKNWPVSQCTETFLKLVDKAFTTKWHHVSFGTTKYRTKPLEEALMEAFGSATALFGGNREVRDFFARKVAVTSATETGEKAVIFTNYNRAEDSQIPYQLIRPDDPKNSLQIWEAARATSAAPTYFKPFRNSRTNQGYLDGAVFYNNPVRIANYESKLLWPDAEDIYPDILLSIGTGHHGGEDELIEIANKSDRRQFQIRRKLLQADQIVRKKKSFTKLPVESWLNIFKNRAESVLDPELAWRDFHKDVTANSSPIAAARFVRINPRTMNKTPKLDDKDQVHELRKEVKYILNSSQMRMSIEKIAHRLIASSFYFQKSGPLRDAGDCVTVQGTIACRFGAGSDHLRYLGDYIRKHQMPSFQPYFLIHEVKHEERAQKIVLTAKIINEMIERGMFKLESVAIPVTTHTALVSMKLYMNDQLKRHLGDGFPISGFPRTLEDGGSLKRGASQSSDDNQPLRMSAKRRSLRDKRNPTHLLPHRTSSDSNINYALLKPQFTAAPVELTAPDSPDDVGDWARRRDEANRPPPRYEPVIPAEYIYELESGITEAENEQDDKEYIQILEESRMQAALEERQRLVKERTNTSTDEEELAKVLQLSMVDR